MEVEIYTLRRRAEFLLNNAVDAADLRRMRAEVKRMGLDPDSLKYVPVGRPRKR